MYIHKFNIFPVNNDDYMFRFLLQTKAPLENILVKNSSGGLGPHLWGWPNDEVVFIVVLNHVIACGWFLTGKFAVDTGVFFFFSAADGFSTCDLLRFCWICFCAESTGKAPRKQEPFFSLMQCVLF